MIGKLLVDSKQLTNFCENYSYLLVTPDNSSMDEMLPVTGIEPLDLARARNILPIYNEAGLDMDYEWQVGQVDWWVKNYSSCS